MKKENYYSKNKKNPYKLIIPELYEKDLDSKEFNKVDLFFKEISSKNEQKKNTSTKVIIHLKKKCTEYEKEIENLKKSNNNLKNENSDILEKFKEIENILINKNNVKRKHDKKINEDKIKNFEDLKKKLNFQEKKLKNCWLQIYNKNKEIENLNEKYDDLFLDYKLERKKWESLHNEIIFKNEENNQNISIIQNKFLKEENNILNDKFEDMKNMIRKFKSEFNWLLNKYDKDGTEEFHKIYEKYFQFPSSEKYINTT